MTTNNPSWIEIFTTPACPDCIALKRWFTAHGIPFVERDLRDPAIADEARRRTGIRIAPITVIDGSAYCGRSRTRSGRSKPRLVCSGRREARR